MHRARPVTIISFTSTRLSWSWPSINRNNLEGVPQLPNSNAIIMQNTPSQYVPLTLAPPNGHPSLNMDFVYSHRPATFAGSLTQAPWQRSRWRRQTRDVGLRPMRAHRSGELHREHERESRSAAISCIVDESGIRHIVDVVTWALTHGLHA